MSILAKIKKKRTWDINIGVKDTTPSIELTDHGLSEADYFPIIYQVIDLFSSDCKSVVVSQIIESSPAYSVDIEGLLGKLKDEYHVDYDISPRKSLYLLEENVRETNAYTVHLYGKPNIEWIKKIIRFGPSSVPNVMYLYNRHVPDWISYTEGKDKSFIRWSNRSRVDTHEILLDDGVKRICCISDGHLVLLIDESYVFRIIKRINEIANDYSYKLNIQIID